VAPSTKFQIKDSATIGQDKLSWQWSKGEAFTRLAEDVERMHAMLPVPLGPRGVS
jgi:hypothetical protein